MMSIALLAALVSGMLSAVVYATIAETASERPASVVSFATGPHALR
jgi:hypothetical protein